MVVIVDFVVDLNVCAHEGVKVDQANGDVGAIGFMAGFLGEAACGNVEPAVSRAKSGNERPDCGRAHGALAMFDLGDNARTFFDAGASASRGAVLSHLTERV